MRLGKASYVLSVMYLCLTLDIVKEGVQFLEVVKGSGAFCHSRVKVVKLLDF